MLPQRSRSSLPAAKRWASPERRSTWCHLWRYPDPAQLPTLEKLIHFEAVRLFVDRATAALPAFALTETNAPAVAQICQRLDGIPLALELAAARVKALSVEHIVARLNDRFRLLTSGSRAALPRQQTLQATIDWSYSLLSAEERALFQRLAVFMGGWKLEAVEVICAEPRNRQVLTCWISWPPW